MTSLSNTTAVVTSTTTTTAIVHNPYMVRKRDNEKHKTMIDTKPLKTTGIATATAGKSCVSDFATITTRTTKNNNDTDDYRITFPSTLSNQNDTTDTKSSINDTTTTTTNSNSYNNYNNNVHYSQRLPSQMINGSSLSSSPYEILTIPEIYTIKDYNKMNINNNSCNNDSRCSKHTTTIVPIQNVRVTGVILYSHIHTNNDNNDSNNNIKEQQQQQQPSIPSNNTMLSILLGNPLVTTKTSITSSSMNGDSQQQQPKRNQYHHHHRHRVSFAPSPKQHQHQQQQKEEEMDVSTTEKQKNDIIDPLTTTMTPTTTTTTMTPTNSQPKREGVDVPVTATATKKRSILLPRSNSGGGSRIHNTTKNPYDTPIATLYNNNSNNTSTGSTSSTFGSTTMVRKKPILVYQPKKHNSLILSSSLSSSTLKDTDGTTTTSTINNNNSNSNRRLSFAKVATTRTITPQPQPPSTTTTNVDDIHNVHVQQQHDMESNDENRRNEDHTLPPIPSSFDRLVQLIDSTVMVYDLNTTQDMDCQYKHSSSSSSSSITSSIVNTNMIWIQIPLHEAMIGGSIQVYDLITVFGEVMYITNNCNNTTTTTTNNPIPEKAQSVDASVSVFSDDKCNNDNEVVSNDFCSKACINADSDDKNDQINDETIIASTDPTKQSNFHGGHVTVIKSIAQQVLDYCCRNRTIHCSNIPSYTSLSSILNHDEKVETTNHNSNISTNNMAVSTTSSSSNSRITAVGIVYIKARIVRNVNGTNMKLYTDALMARRQCLASKMLI